MSGDFERALPLVVDASVAALREGYVRIGAYLSLLRFLVIVRSCNQLQQEYRSRGIRATSASISMIVITSSGSAVGSVDPTPRVCPAPRVPQEGRNGQRDP